MTEVIDFLQDYGYIILFIYSLGGGMVAIFAAGILAHMGKLDISICIVVAACANALGDSLLFYISRYNRALIDPYIANHKRKLALSQLLMRRHGDWIIFFQKFIYGVKTLVPLAIGLTRYSFMKFNILNIISSFAWAVILGLLSYEFGAFFQNIAEHFSDKPYLMPLIGLVLFALIWLYFEKRTAKKLS